MVPLFLALALQTPAAPAPTVLPVKTKVEDPYEKVCRHDQRTGSRINTPVCHTREEWVRIEEGAKAYMDKILHPTGCAPGSTC